MTPAELEGKLVVQLSVSELRQLIAEEIAAALQNGAGHISEKDKLLIPTEAAEMLGQNVRWLYRHASKLPFSRRLPARIFGFQRGDCGAGSPPETHDRGR
jgi:hypothetical protein